MRIAVTIVFQGNEKEGLDPARGLKGNPGKLRIGKPGLPLEHTNREYKRAQLMRIDLTERFPILCPVRCSLYADGELKVYALRGRHFPR